MNDYKSLYELYSAEHVWSLVFCFNVSNDNRLVGRWVSGWWVDGSVVDGFNKTPQAVAATSS